MNLVLRTWSSSAGFPEAFNHRVNRELLMQVVRGIRKIIIVRRSRYTAKLREVPWKQNAASSIILVGTGARKHSQG